MTEQYNKSLLALPPELLYRICDFLDIETLLVSFRCVSTKLYAIADTYHRYKLYFPSTLKINICQFLQPENIISLNFGTKRHEIDWIERFLPLFKTHQFTRLHSLCLHQTNINNLNIILYNVAMHCRLRYFAIYSSIPKENQDIFELLFQIITQPTLRNIILYSDLRDKDNLLWPTQSTVEKLSMSICTIEQFCYILGNSPHLHSLIMDSCYISCIDESILLNSYPQITSLTLNEVRMTMDKLELLLSLLPSIIHLDLSSSGRPFEFARRLSRWEEFIPSKLPKLSQLEFCIFCYCSNWDNFETLIDAFRTSFWLKEKRWFVTCQFRDDWTTSFTIFTSPESSIDSRSKERYFDKVTCNYSNINQHD